jgi:hypothetical protein
MSHGREEVDRLRRVVLESEHGDYSSYLALKRSLVKERMLAEMHTRYLEKSLTEEEVLQYIGRCSPESLGVFSKIYEHEESYDRGRALAVLKERYTQEADQLSRESIFQAMRKVAGLASFETVLELCDDELLSLIVGECARRHGLDVGFFDRVEKFIPYVFVAYTHVNELLLDSFEPAFDKLIELNLEILSLLNFESKKVRRAALKNMHKNGVVDYMIEHRLGSRRLLEKIFHRAGTRTKCRLLGTGELDAGRLLMGLPGEEVIEILMELRNNERIYEMAQETVVERLEELGRLDGVVDVILVMLYHNDAIKLGERIGCIRDCAEKNFLSLREREFFNRKMEVDMEHGIIRKRHIVEHELFGPTSPESASRCEGHMHGFNPSGPSEGYLRSIIIEETDDITIKARKTHSFSCFLRLSTTFIFSHLIALPSKYLLRALSILSHPFLDLLDGFGRIATAAGRGKNFISKKILDLGYRKEFIQYLIAQDSYYRIEVDYNGLSPSMSLRYKAKYLKDFPNTFIESQETVLEEFKDHMHMLLPAIEAVRNDEEQPQEVVERFRPFALQMIRRGEYLDGAFKAMVSRKSGAYKALDGQKPASSSWDEVVEEYTKAVNGRTEGKRIKAEEAALPPNTAAAQTFSFSISRTEKAEEKRLNGDEFREAVADEGVSYGFFENGALYNRIGLISGMAGEAIRSTLDMRRTARIAAILIRDSETLMKVVRCLHKSNSLGKHFASLTAFFILFLRHCRIRIGLSQEMLRLLRKMATEGRNRSVIYYAALKIEISDLVAFCDTFIGDERDLVVWSVSDRIKASAEGRRVLADRFDERDEVEMWNGENEQGLLKGALMSFLDSRCDNKILCGLKGLEEMGFYEVDVVRFLNSRSDEVVGASLAMLQKKEITPRINEELLEILYKRGRLDDVGRSSLRILNLGLIEQEDADRIFNLFFIDPLSYLEILPRLLERGYQISSAIALELVRRIGRVYDEKTLACIGEVIRDIEFTDELVSESIISLEEENHGAKLILIEKLLRSVKTLSTRMVLQLCVIIGNEENYIVLGGLLSILRVVGVSPRLVEAWKDNRALRRLILRIYPVCMADGEYYLRLFHEYLRIDRDECNFLSSFFKEELKEIRI